MSWPWERRSSPPTVTPPRVPAAGWAFLPPLQRQVSDAPPLTLAPSFASWLPTRAAPQRMGTMGHLVTSGAPAGTVAGTTAQLGVPVQRSIAADLTLRPPSWGRPPRAASTTAPTFPPATQGDPAPVDPGTDGAAPPPAAMPLPAATTGSAAEGSHGAADTGPSVHAQLTEVPSDVSPDHVSSDDASYTGADRDETTGAEAVDAAAGLLAQPHSGGVRPSSGTPAPVGTPRSVQRREEHLPRSPGTVLPPPPPIRARRLGLGAPLTPSVQSPMPIVQRVDAPASTPTVSRSAAWTQPDASPSGAPGTLSTREPREIGPAADRPAKTASTADRPPETAESIVGTIASAPLPEVPLGPNPTPSPATGATEPPRVATTHEGAALPLPRVQRSQDDPGTDPAVDTVVDDVPSGEGARSSAEQGTTAQTVPLIAQRALSPMLAPSTPARPVQRRYPHATVLVDADRSPAAPAAFSTPSRNAAPGDPSVSSRDTDGVARGGFVGWLQRLVGAEEAPRAHDAGHAPTGPGAAFARTGPTPAVQRAVTAAQLSTRAAEAGDAGAGDPPGGGVVAQAGSVPASTRQPLLPTSSLSRAPISRVSARVAVQALATQALATQSPATIPMPVAARDRLPRYQDGTVSADVAAFPAPTPASGIGTLQRAEAPLAEPAPPTDAEDAPAPDQAAPTAAASGRAPTTAGSDPVSPTAVEALAAQLYGPIVRRLKTELLLDRERRGLRIDGI